MYDVSDSDSHCSDHQYQYSIWQRNFLFSYQEVTQEEADQGKEVDMTFSVSYR